MPDESVNLELLQTRNWYIRQRGKELGPMTESELRRRLERSRVDPDSFARQGDSDYFPIAKIRELFDALSESGWYVLEDGNVHGPYLIDKLSELMHTGFFSAHADLVRQGKDGDWRTWNEAWRNARKQTSRKQVNSQQISKPPSGDSNDPDQRDTASLFATCETCERSYPRIQEVCNYCLRAEEEQEQRTQERATRHAQGNSPERISHLFLFGVTLGTSGFFFSKWLITSMVFRGYYTSGEQTTGWFYFGVAAVLMGAGAMILHSNVDRRRDTQFLVSGPACFLLVGFLFYLSQHGRISQARQQQQQQDKAWNEMMSEGGYGNWQD